VKPEVAEEVDRMTPLEEEERKYWFPAKRYGWGWGLPTVWQGWATILAYLVALSLCAYVYPPASKPASFLESTVVISILLIAVCWIKGEPLKWRWGKR